MIFSPILNSNSDQSMFSKCSIQSKHTWPEATKTILNESQYNALSLSLNNRLTIIQG